MNTIKDVARVAGVSFATVSRALRGLDGVRPETRERVLQAARQLDYLASPAAASLATGRARVIAVVAPFHAGWEIPSLVGAISSELGLHDHQAVLVDLVDTSQGRQQLTTRMLRNRVDGIITLNLGLDQDELSLVDRLRLPLVAVGRTVPGRSAVRINDAVTLRSATEHLISLGHRRIAYLGQGPGRGAQLDTLRLNSFVATLHDHGLSALQRHVLTPVDSSAAGAAQAIMPILERADRPSAVVAASDEIAFGVMQSARQLGLSIPADLSVVGVDDYLLAEVIDLTTMHRDLDAQGRQAATILLRALVDPCAETENVMIPTRLVVRGTTSKPAPRQRRHPAPTAQMQRGHSRVSMRGMA